MTVRALRPPDLAGVRAVIDSDPVVNVFVDSLIEASGLDPRRGAEVWGYAPAADIGQPGRMPVSICHAGGNLIPVGADEAALDLYAERAITVHQRCFQIVGLDSQVSGIWQRVARHWPRPREVRLDQPYMMIDRPAAIRGHMHVRKVQPAELDLLYPACVAMYTEEVGVEPYTGPDGSFYRARVAELIRTGCAFAWIRDGQVIFKAEVGAIGRHACQIQGVWVDPEHRGKGIAAPAMASVIEYARRIRPVVTLYVNSYNEAALRAYEKAGFTQVATFATVLF